MKNIRKILLSMFILIMAIYFILPLAAVAQEEPAPEPSGDETKINLKPTTEETGTNTDFNQGLDFFYQKRWADSVEFFEAAVKKDPMDTMSLSFLLTANYKRNELIPSVNKIEQNAINGGNTPLLKAQLGIAYISRGLIDANMLEEARTQLKDALKDNPDLPIANTGMGMIYFQKRLTSRAKGYFIKALKSNDKDLMAMELLGNILMVDEKKPDAALEFFLRLTELAPKYSDGFFMAGSAYQKLGKNEEAIKYFSRSMELDPLGVTNGYYAPLRIGDIYLNEKEWDQAKKYYQAALKINPENPYAKTQLKKAENQGREWTGEKYDPLKKKIEE